MKSFTRSTIASLSASLCLLAPLLCHATAITWTGAVNTDWNTTTANWKKNSDNSATTFANNDDVSFVNSVNVTPTTATGMYPNTITHTGSGFVNQDGQGIQVNTVTMNNASGQLHFNKPIGGGGRNFVVLQGVLGIGGNTVQVNSLVMSAGQFRVGKYTTTAAGSMTLVGTVTYNGTTDGAKITKWGGTGPVNLNGGSRTFDIANGTAAVDLLVTLPVVSLTGTGSLVKNGLGTLELSGNNTYNGTTSVNAGRLLISGTTSGQGDCTVAADATLGGSGTFGLAAGKKVAFLNGGRLEADASGADPLHIAGDLDLSAGGAVAAFVGTPTDGATVLTYSGSRTGTFGAKANLSSDFRLSYDTPNAITLVKVPTATLLSIR